MCGSGKNIFLGHFTVGSLITTLYDKESLKMIEKQEADPVSHTNFRKILASYIFKRDKFKSLTRS